MFKHFLVTSTYIRTSCDSLDCIILLWRISVALHCFKGTLRFNLEWLRATFELRTYILLFIGWHTELLYIRTYVHTYVRKEGTCNHWRVLPWKLKVSEILWSYGWLAHMYSTHLQILNIVGAHWDNQPLTLNSLSQPVTLVEVSKLVSTSIHTYTHLCTHGEINSAPHYIQTGLYGYTYEVESSIQPRSNWSLVNIFNWSNSTHKLALVFNKIQRNAFYCGIIEGDSEVNASLQCRNSIPNRANSGRELTHAGIWACSLKCVF